MKISLTFKTPDVCHHAAENLVGGDDDEDEKEQDNRIKEVEVEIKRLLYPWVRNGECVTIDFDTDDGTAVVRKKR